MTYNELFKDTPKTVVMAILKDKDQEAIIREVVNLATQSSLYLHQQIEQRYLKTWLK